MTQIKQTALTVHMKTDLHSFMSYIYCLFFILLRKVKKKFILNFENLKKRSFDL